MKAKRLLPLLLAGAMAVSVGALAACTPKDDNGDDKKPNGGGGNYTVDTTEYYIVGGGEGSLKQNGWNETNHVLAMTRDESADHNVFSIDLDLYANDAFQIVHDDSWDGQMGLDYFLDCEEDDELGNVVKNADDEIVFVGTGMFKKDITLQVGHDGNYTINLHTYPDGEKDAYITWEKNSELAALMDMYVVTDMNDFGFLPDPYAASHMTKNGDIWQFVLEIKAEDLCRDENGAVVTEGAEYVAVAVQNDVEDEDGVKAVISDISGTYASCFIDGVEYNLLGEGTYTLRYNAETNALTIVEGAYELYFIGDFNGWDQSAQAEWKLTEGNDGNWTGYLTLTEAAGVKLFNPLKNGWYDNNGGENMQLTAGTYFFKFITATETVEYELVEYYIVGTLYDGEGNPNNFSVAESTPKLTLNEDGTYTVEIEVTDVTSDSNYSWIAEGYIFACKVIRNTATGGIDWDWANVVNNIEATDFVEWDGGNLVFKAAGTYKFTLDLTANIVSIAVVEGAAE